MPAIGEELVLEFSETRPGGGLVVDPAAQQASGVGSETISQAIEAALKASPEVTFNQNFETATEAFPGVPMGDPMR